MAKLRFPVASASKTFFPTKPLCPMCKKHKVFEPHSMVVLNLGAIKMTDRAKRAGSMSDDLDGFLNLIWHGAHNDGVGNDPNINVYFPVIDDVRGGQADLYFCSTTCLRAFFNSCVDEFERRLDKARKKKGSDQTLQKMRKKPRASKR